MKNFDAFIFDLDMLLSSFIPDLEAKVEMGFIGRRPLS